MKTSSIYMPNEKANKRNYNIFNPIISEENHWLYIFLAHLKMKIVITVFWVSQ